MSRCLLKSLFTSTEPDKIIGKAGGSVFIPCRVVTNNKNGGIMWYKDGAFMVSFTPSTKKKAFADQTLSLRLSIDMAGLNLTDLAINDSGNYMCKVVMPVLKPDDPSILEENSTEILLVQGKHTCHRKCFHFHLNFCDNKHVFLCDLPRVK